MDNPSPSVGEVVIYQDLRWRVMSLDEFLKWRNSLPNSLFKRLFATYRTHGSNSVFLYPLNDAYNVIVVSKQWIRRLPSTQLMESARDD
jgi:hypothetical protein